MSMVKMSKHLCPTFVHILPKFSTNQNHWGCACILCTTSSYTTGDSD